MKRRLRLLSLQLALAVLALCLWQAGATIPIGHDPEPVYLLPQFFFSNPADVARRVGSMVSADTAKIVYCRTPLDLPHLLSSANRCFAKTVWQHLLVTLVEALLSFVIGSVLAIVLGFWFARKPLLGAVIGPYIKIMNSLPRVIFAPMFMLWLGLGIWSKVALGVTLVFFVVFYSVYQGVREANPVILDNARMLGMSDYHLLKHVYWPSAMSWMFASLHTAVGFAIIGAVVGEYLGASAGIGYMIQQSEGNFDITGVFAGLVILSAAVLLVDAVVTRVERRLLAWQPSALAH